MLNISHSSVYGAETKCQDEQITLKHFFMSRPSGIHLGVGTAFFVPKFFPITKLILA
jgi:hypothetical protein